MADKIIIFSGKQYSGKDTAALILLKALPAYRRCAMGDIIKIEYGKLNNITFEEIEHNQQTYRQGLIDVGTWGRVQSPDYWLDKIISQEGNIVVTDVRIKHEYEVFKNAGAVSIRIEAERDIRIKRGGILVGENDVTEVDLDDIQDWDYIVDNNKSYDELEQNILRIAEELS